MLGYPGSGKTVYLTVLFNELAVNRTSGLTFSPYGSETIERVNNNLNILARGEWLSSTVIGELFPFRAIVVLKPRIYRRSFRIEIGDFAGEHVKEFMPLSERWLHKSKYFNYVIQSDAVFLIVDMTSLLPVVKKEEVDQIQNAFKAALQILFEQKKVAIGKKMRTPVAIILTKTDLCGFDEALTIFKSRMRELNGLCEQILENYHVFPISSVGAVKPDGNPPDRLRPYGIVEPLVWILKNAWRVEVV